jgi:beta-lactamase class A
MSGNTPGNVGIRGALPGGGKMADKTGTSDYGSGNDIGVI